MCVTSIMLKFVMVLLKKTCMNQEQNELLSQSNKMSLLVTRLICTRKCFQCKKFIHSLSMVVEIGQIVVYKMIEVKYESGSNVNEQKFLAAWIQNDLLYVVNVSPWCIRETGVGARTVWNKKKSASKTYQDRCVLLTRN